MQPSATLRDPPIPHPPQAETADRATTPAAAASLHAALLRLVWLTIYVAVMRALGYRIRRAPTQRTPRHAQPPASVRAAPSKPRRQHRYLDRDAMVRALAGISSQFAAARPHPAPADAAPAPPPRKPALRRPRAIRCPRAQRGRASVTAIHPRLTPPPASPPLSKSGLQNRPTLAQFVAIS